MTESRSQSLYLTIDFLPNHDDSSSLDNIKLSITDDQLIHYFGQIEAESTLETTENIDLSPITGMPSPYANITHDEAVTAEENNDFDAFYAHTSHPTHQLRRQTRQQTNDQTTTTADTSN